MKLTPKLLRLAASELARRVGKARMAGLSENERRELGRRGGQARAKRLSKEQRREISQRAVKARWAALTGKSAASWRERSCPLVGPCESGETLSVRRRGWGRMTSLVLRMPIRMGVVPGGKWGLARPVKSELWDSRFFQASALQ